MSKTINFGIDLGTTNSLIAKFNKGTVEVYKNPIDFKETLPSLVGFKNDRILIGDQAISFVERDPQNVIGNFKRKMGTTESFKIKLLDQSKTPVELSAFLLKELKTFIHTGETPEAVVITIPASFDMVQSNATKEAGHQAGFKQVVLLQEPIAASLAYANKTTGNELNNSQWIVYDLGGGTFDVALVRIAEGELKVIDHEGDNFLGGTDFDALIVERIVIPALEKRGRFEDLPGQLKSATGRLNRKWPGLLRSAEQAKKVLSTKTSAEIDVEITDDSGAEVSVVINVTRSDFEAIIKEAVDATAEMLRTILTRNSLQPSDLKFVLMVGGSTYIPLVRNRIKELLGIPVNTDIDPTNAVVIGAAYYAGNKPLELTEANSTAPTHGRLKVKVSYNKASQETEEMFSAKVEGELNGFTYRISRDDGGYDSGLKQLSKRISEDLPLQPDSYNSFTLKILDQHNDPMAVESIQIAQGKYSVAGQMLPDDLCLVKDNLEDGDTKLEQVFARNTILPAKKKLTVDVSKTLVHGTDDEIRIIVVEGSSTNHSASNKFAGILLVSAKNLKRDLLKGTEIDLTFEVSESRAVTVQAYINPSGPEFSDVFTPKDRKVDVKTLADEIGMLEEKIEQEKAEALEQENYEVVDVLSKLSGPVQELQGEAVLLTLDDVTDNKYKLEDRKRKIAQALHQATSTKRIERLRSEYIEARDEISETVKESGNDIEKRQLQEIVNHEHVFLNTNSTQRLAEHISKLHSLHFQILKRTPDFLVGWFKSLMEKRETFNDQVQAKNLIEAGKQHIQAEDFDRLLEVNQRLFSLLPEKEQESKDMRHFTGIS
ncbi:MAG: Hsp70 family protein [Flavobacteriales bacterium]|jgi:molecular chaperone DnaK